MKVVLRDIIPFSTVLVASLLCFSLLDVRLNSETFFEAFLSNNLNIIFGDFDTEEYTALFWIAYMLKQFILTISFLNILIAIVSASY